MNINENIFTVLADILGLSLFAGLRETMLLNNFKNLIESISEEKTQDAVFFAHTNATLDLVEKWAAFMEAFVEEQRGNSFYLTLAWMTMTHENPYTLAVEGQGIAGKTPAAPPSILSAMAKTDLSRLGRIASFDIPSLGFHVAETCRKSGLDKIAGSIEEESRVIWAAEGKKDRAEIAENILAIFPEDSNWGMALPAFTGYIRGHGAGLLGLYVSFRWEWADASLTMPPISPVKNPDPVRLDDFCGYEEQRSVVIANTLRFIEGKAANNFLLYGDRGTGKSATVKAICNEYASRGLRLLEIHKSDVCQLSTITDFLAGRGLRFIIFIDDLSFEVLDDSFTGLKALLEGGAETRPPNVVFYATSNRRHLVKEQFSGRFRSSGLMQALAGLEADEPDEEARSFDTMEEQFSLSDRFGLTVTFAAPDQEEYLKIAEHIARRRGIFKETGDEESLKTFRENALRWERWFNGRSPRTAVQYVDWIAGGAGFPWE